MRRFFIPFFVGVLVSLTLSGITYEFAIWQRAIILTVVALISAVIFEVIIPKAIKKRKEKSSNSEEI